MLKSFSSWIFVTSSWIFVKEKKKEGRRANTPMFFNALQPIMEKLP